MSLLIAWCYEHLSLNLAFVRVVLRVFNLNRRQTSYHIFSRTTGRQKFVSIIDRQAKQERFKVEHESTFFSLLVVVSGISSMIRRRNHFFSFVFYFVCVTNDIVQRHHRDACLTIDENNFIRSWDVGPSYHCQSIRTFLHVISCARLEMTQLRIILLSNFLSRHSAVFITKQ